MKTSHKNKNPFSQPEAKNLTFGDLVAATYSELGGQGARRILQLAMESHIIKFSRSRCMS